MFEFCNEESLLSADKLIRNNGKFPKTVIAVWQDAIAKQAMRVNPKKIASFTCGPKFTIFALDEYAFCNIPSGGPAAACFIEECKARGAVNFVFTGACGLLDEKLADKLIVPSKALRDEGVSAHYTADKDKFIDITTAGQTSLILEGIPHVCAPVWTTDCPYRETLSAVENARKENCVAVDMECASIAAVSDFLEVNSYYVLFPADMFSISSWDSGKLFSKDKNIYSSYLDLALLIAKAVNRS